MGDNSALTHLATGRLILEDWAIPRHDPYSFTATEAPWTVYSWLASTGMALVERAGGGDGIQLARAAITCALAGLVWVLTRPAGALGGRIITTAAVLVVGTGAWTERPLLLALLLLAFVVLLAERDRGPSWPVAVAMWVWVNVHGSFPLALVYLGARLVGRRLDRSPLGQLRPLLGAAVVGTLAGAVNPLGPRLLVFPFELLGRSELLARVLEWRSPNFSQPPNLVLLGALLLALLLCTRRAMFEDAFVAVVFGAAACLAVRNAPFAMIVLTPVLARGLRGMGTVSGGARSRLTGVGAIALSGFAILLVASSLQGPAYDLEKYPVAEVAWMESQGLMDGRVATQDFVGNFLIARRGRNANVFFDDRFDMYPRAVILDYVALLDGTEGWQRRLDRYRIDAVLWERSEPLAGLLRLDPGWRVVRRDAEWVVAVRASQ